MGGKFSKKKKNPSDEWRQIIPCASREPIESKYTIGEQIGKFVDLFSSLFISFFTTRDFSLTNKHTEGALRL